MKEEGKLDDDNDALRSEVTETRAIKKDVGNDGDPPTAHCLEEECPEDNDEEYLYEDSLPGLSVITLRPPLASLAARRGVPNLKGFEELV